MTGQKNINGFSCRVIEADDGITRAVIVPELGAITASLVLPGPDGSPRETLFQQAHFWERDTELTRGGLPFLFPICGRLARDGEGGIYLYENRRYSMPIHGFAHRLPWRVVAADKTSEIVLRLADTPHTRQMYPFAFEIILTYRVEPGILVCEQRYVNRDERCLPYYAGFHPYFRTPPPENGKSGVRLDLNPSRFLKYNSALTDVIGITDKIPDFPVSVTAPEINEQLIRMSDDKQIRLLYPDAFELLMRADSAEDPGRFPYIQLYTVPGQPFFCVEPWMGVPNSMNTVSGARWLEPGKSDCARLRIGAGKII